MKELDYLKTILKSGLFQRTFIYTFSASLNALVAFLLLPVLTRYLSLYDYGIVETFMAVTTLLTGVVMIGGTSILSKEYFNYSKEELICFIGNILGTIYIASISLMIIFLGVSAFDNIISDYLKINNVLIMFAIVVSFANACITLLTTLFQLEKKSKSYALFTNSRTITEIVISLIFIVIAGLQWEGRISGIVLSNILFLFVAYYLLKVRKINVRLPRKYGKTILRLGLPMVIVHISVWVYGMVDKIMINNLIDVQSTGLYSVGYRFGMVVNMIEASFSIAFLPFFFENYSKGEYVNHVKIVKVTYVYAVILFLFAFSYGIFGKYLLFFMVDKKFYEASRFIFLISIAYYFSGIWKVFTGYLIAKGRMLLYSYIACFAAVMHIVLNYFFLKNFGLIGSAWATLISMATGAALTIIAGISISRMPWLFFMKR